MTEQNSASKPQGLAPAITQTNEALLLKMVELLLAQQTEEMQEKAERKRAQEAKDAQRKINAEYAQKEKQKIQSICTHKKGGKLQSPRTDFALYHFTFTDQTTYIRCQICGMKWRKVDTDEFLVRRGEKIPNHTGIGWLKALQMLGQSTNTPSSAEVTINTVPLATEIGKLE